MALMGRFVAAPGPRSPLAAVVAVRLVHGGALLVVVTLATFLLLQAAPGSFVDRLRLDPGVAPGVAERVARRFGLDEPWYRQYLSWLAGAVRGDLGLSLTYQRPVRELLVGPLAYTLALVGLAQLASGLAGLGVAVVGARAPGGKLDRLLAALALGLASMPVLVLALGGLALAAATGAFPVGGASSLAGLVRADDPRLWLDRLHHLALPVLVLCAGLGPTIYLQARGVLVDETVGAIARAARARGVPESRVLARHLLPVALAVVVSFMAASLGRWLSAAFVVEVVMGWPGLGRLAWTALLARDPFVLLGVIAAQAAILFLGHLAADLAVARLDPRIRLEETLGP